MTDASNSPETLQRDDSVTSLDDDADYPQSRAAVLWGRKWIILLAVLVVGALSGVFAATRQMEYVAQATVRVSLLQTQDSGSQIAIAANEYAAQYAQIVNSDPVLEPVSRSTGVSVSQLRSRVTATPINKYNVVGISVTTDSAKRASGEANAIAASLVEYVATSDETEIKASSDAVTDQRKSLDTSIDKARGDVARDKARLTGAGVTADAAASSLASSRNYLASLISLRQTLYLSPVRELVQSRPTLTVLNSPTRGSEQPRRAVAYAAVGAVVGGVVIAELFLLVAQARGRRRH